MIQKMALSVKTDSNNKPIGVLYRTPEGSWEWMGIIPLDEDGQVSLMDNQDGKIS